jgi:hypothetical protein
MLIKSPRAKDLLVIAHSSFLSFLWRRMQFHSHTVAINAPFPIKISSVIWGFSMRCSASLGTNPNPLQLHLNTGIWSDYDEHLLAYIDIPFDWIR